MAAANQINALPEDGTAHLRPVSARQLYANASPPMTFRTVQSAKQRRKDVETVAEEGEDKGEVVVEDAEEEELDPLQSYRSRLESPDVEEAEEQNARLSFLEEKLRRWLQVDNPRGKPQVEQLRRFPVKDMEFQPRPGNKIYVRKRDRTTKSQASTISNDNVFINGRSSNGNVKTSRSESKQGRKASTRTTVKLTSTGMKETPNAYKILLSQ